MLLRTCLLAIAFLSASATANTEKVIFTAPRNITLGDARPGLLDLSLDTITPTHLVQQVLLPVAFPTDENPRGPQSWYLLQSLQEGQRYEVRVCWPATSPTEFWLETYSIIHVLETPSLLQDLAAYVEDRQEDLLSRASDPAVQDSATTQSALLLRVWSAADFYAADQQLMQNPPPVKVDIILDPYLFNIFPQSLLPTAGYIAVLAVGASLISQYIWRILEGVSQRKKHIE
ncbi:hypothetical protein AAFC00_001305 [Neodothiora populina]|uniref:Uncharacterized protein n=1 Tax=Neodothiora populina TaxID=2781224 RepID=A0ABR3PPG8_9PEZI